MGLIDHRQTATYFLTIYALANTLNLSYLMVPMLINWTVATAQLPGRLFSPSDISKKLSHHFLLYFPNGMGSYGYHAKYQGVFQDLL